MSYMKRFLKELKKATDDFPDEYKRTIEAWHNV